MSLSKPTSEASPPLTLRRALVVWASMTVWIVGVLIVAAFAAGRQYERAVLAEERLDVERAYLVVVHALYRARAVQEVADSTMAQVAAFRGDQAVGLGRRPNE